jgi:hypothetical protein
MDIYIIRNGAIVPYLKDGMRRNAQLPVLPPDVARIEITWMAEDDVVSTPKLVGLSAIFQHFRSVAPPRAKSVVNFSFLACV